MSVLSSSKRQKQSPQTKRKKENNIHSNPNVKKSAFPLTSGNSSWRLWKLNIDLIKCIFRRSANLVYRSHLEKKTPLNLSIFLVILINRNFTSVWEKNEPEGETIRIFSFDEFVSQTYRNFDMTAWQSILWNWSHFWTLVSSQKELFCLSVLQLF